MGIICNRCAKKNSALPNSGSNPNTMKSDVLEPNPSKGPLFETEKVELSKQPEGNIPKNNLNPSSTKSPNDENSDNSLEIPEELIDINRKNFVIKPPNQLVNKPEKLNPPKHPEGFANIISSDSEFKEIADDFEKHLKSKENRKIKLRASLMILKNLTEDEEQDNSRYSLEKFFGLTEEHYRKLYNEFEKTNQTYKPLIKLLQILDLFLEKCDDKQTRKEIVNRIHKSLSVTGMLIIDWRFLRKLCEQREGEKLEVFSSWRGDLVQGFLRRIEKTKRALLWRYETEGVKYAKEIIDFISSLGEESLFKFLLMGRFDKEEMGMKVAFSMIVGDEGGLFLLINSVPPGSRQEKCILEAGVSEEFLRAKRAESNNKVILGKGSFGQVRLALSVLGNSKVDIGQLVCTKKSLPIGEKKPKESNPLSDIMDSTLEDFFARKLNDSIHAPIPLDMAILNSNLNQKRHRKGYLIMEIVPENTADKILCEQKYQKWEYQKPYMLAVMKTTNDMLSKDRIFNSDLKPPNTLFDVLSRKMAIIDLGSSLFIDKNQNLEEFDASVGGFGVSEPYCPPEIKDENNIEKLSLKKAISYLCGMTIAEVVFGIAAIKKAKKVGDWNLTAEYTDLDEDSKKLLTDTIKRLTEKNPLNRLDLSVAIETIGKIGLNADEIMKKATAEQYIEKVRKLAKERPSALSLNEDINETRKKGVIQQLVVESNPKRYKHQKTTEINKELDDCLNDNSEEEKALVILGEAGSGKSLALQLRFAKEIEEWEYGKKALPLFFNMADEVDLEKVMNRLNTMLGCNIKLDDPNEEIHLFIDSYDEGRPEEILNSVEQKEKNLESEKKITLVEQYFEKLSKWKRRKIVISCRTDFVQREGGDDLSEFEGRNMKSLRVIYIAPITYEGGKEKIINKEKSEIDEQVRDWLKREEIKDKKPEEVISKLKKLAVEGRMTTGLMFSMIMKMVVPLGGDENISNMRLKGFEIYRRTIREEFRNNWGKVVSREGSVYKNSEEMIISIIKEEIEDRLKQDFNKEDKTTIKIMNDSEMIWEGMERIGELLATEMIFTKSTRVKYSEIERLLNKKNKHGNQFDPDERTEWKTLYQILRIMGLKMERRKDVVKKDEDEDENEETIDIGFRHETYKNYYLLRSLKRLLQVVIRETMSGKECTGEAFLEEDDSSRIVAALLEEERVIWNYELLRFCGEEILNYKDGSLREGLRKLLSLEQRRQVMKKDMIAPLSTVHGSEEKRKASRSAIIMTLLVAGSYQFLGEDLSDLDLAGANMRGGDFFRSKFKNTNLRNANLRHADVREACFVESDLRGLQLGVWPDLIGHEGEVNSVCFSPDRKRIASGGGSDNSVKIWDSLSGECLKTLVGHNGSVYSVCFSPDGKKIASGGGGDSSVRVWDSASGKCERMLAGHFGGLKSVCFSPNGKRIASGGGGDNSVKIWDCLTGDCVKSLEGHNGSVYSVCFSPDGKRIASGGGGDNSVKIWDTASGECIRTIVEHSGSVCSVCFSPDGKRIASGGGGDNLVKIWDSDRDCAQSLVGHSDSVRSVCFSPDGKRIASCGGGDLTVKIWDSGSGECMQTFGGHKDSVRSVSFSPDGKRIASGADDNSVKIWDSASGECVQMLAGHKDWVRSVCFSPDGYWILSAADDDLVKIWHGVSGECVQTIAAHNGTVLSVCLSPDGRLFASGGGSDNSVKIWDSTNGECIKTLVGHNGSVNSVCFSADGKRIASGGGSDSLIKIWNSTSGECVRTIAGHFGGLRSVCFSPEGRTIASGGGGDSSVRIWDSVNGECLQTLVGHNGIVYSVCFSPDGTRIASGGAGENSVRIWDSVSGECIQALMEVCFQCASALTGRESHQAGGTIQ